MLNIPLDEFGETSDIVLTMVSLLDKYDRDYINDAMDDALEFIMERDFSCYDCEVNTSEINEYYMVNFDLWNSVATNGMLCIGCLERRIGRQLVSSDFIDAPINKMGGSARMKSRLTA